MARNSTHRRRQRPQTATFRTGRPRKRTTTRQNRRKAPPLWRRIRPVAAARAVGRGFLRSWPALALVAVFAGALVGGYHGIEWLQSSPRFAVADIQVQGAERADLAPVLDELRGQNVFKLDTGAVEAALAERPWVESASVDRDLPSGLEVTITERVAAAAVDLGGLYLITADAEPFKRATADEAAVVPLITGIDREEFVRASDIAQARLRIALDLISRTAVESRPTLSEVHYDPLHGFSLVTVDEGVTIHLGNDVDEFDARLSAFDAVWAALPEERRSDLRTVYPAGSSTSRTTIAFAQPTTTSENGQN